MNFLIIFYSGLEGGLNSPFTTPILTALGFANPEFFAVSTGVGIIQSINKLSKVSFNNTESIVDAFFQTFGTAVGYFGRKFAIAGEFIQALQYLPFQWDNLKPMPNNTFFTVKTTNSLVRIFNKNAGNLPIPDYQKRLIIIRSGP